MLTHEQIEEAKELAGCFFSEEEIMEIMELDKVGPEFQAACRIGYLKSEAELRKSIFELARNGSSPAQTLAMKLLESHKRKNF